MWTPTEEPSRDGFTTTGSGNGRFPSAASASAAVWKTTYFGVGIPCWMKTCLVATLSIPTEEALTPEPVYGMPMYSSRP